MCRNCELFQTGEYLAGAALSICAPKGNSLRSILIADSHKACRAVSRWIHCITSRQRELMASKVQFRGLRGSACVCVKLDSQGLSTKKVKVSKLIQAHIRNRIIAFAATYTLIPAYLQWHTHTHTHKQASIWHKHTSISSGSSHLAFLSPFKPACALSEVIKPTCDLQLLRADLTLHEYTAPPFGVIGSTQAGHVHDTLLMDIHIAGWRDRERR